MKKFFQMIVLPLMLITFWITEVLAEEALLEQLTQLNHEGQQAYAISDYLTALKKWELGLNLSRQAKNQKAMGSFLGNIGMVYDSLGQYQKALTYYQQALKTTREIQDRSEEGNILRGIGIVYRNLGQNQTALDYFQKALTIHYEIKDKREEGADLFNIGVVYRNLGQYQAALEYYRQALKINREIKDRCGEGNNLNSIGVLYTSLGQYQTALEYYRQALKIRREIQDRSGEGNVLNNIGVVYRRLGQKQTALDYYQRALTIHREIKSRRGEGADLSNIGLVYQNLGQYQTALDYYRQTLIIHREIGGRSGEGTILGNIGIIYQILGQFQTALDYYRQALTIHREIKNRDGEGRVLNNIGDVYQNLDKYHQAKKVLQDSITIFETIGSSDLWLVQGSLAFTEAKLNQHELAIQHYELALDNIEKQRTDITAKKHKISFMQNRLFIYDDFITLLQSLHSNHPKKGYDRKALEIFERKQGRIFLEEMGQSGARLFAGLPKDISEGEQSLEDQLVKIRQQLVDERSKPVVAGIEGEVIQNDELIKNLEQRQQQLQSELDTLREKIRIDYPDYYALKYPQPVQLDTLQQEVLQSGELMLVYSVMEDRTALWIIGKDTFQWLDLPLTETILTKKVNLIRRGIENQLNTQPQLGQKKRGLRRIFKNSLYQKTLSELTYELYILLVPESVRPLLKKADTLYIVPTGPLYALPFEILVTKPVEQPTDTPHYLIEDAPIAYLSSASLLKVLRDTKKRRQKMARYPLLAFANPVYDEKFTPAAQAPESLAAIRRSVYHALRGGYLAPLPESEDEAREIAQLLNAPPETHPLQLREAASRPTVFQFNQQQRLDDYQYVLFATHGILPGEVDHITQSALALSYPNREGYGYLTMADVFSLKLNAKLVSLSACNTGRGEQERGEGVMGLTRAFMYAGTPMIAVTLWPVESVSAKTLNVSFFQHLKYFQKPATALRAIKLRMLRGDKGYKYQHPYYWAPFVVFGEEPVGQRIPEQQGLKYYQQALAMEHELDNKRGEARSLTQLGEVYLDLKQYQQALESFQQALAIHQDLNNNRGIEENWFNLGDTYFELGQYQKGQEYYQRVKTLP